MLNAEKLTRKSLDAVKNAQSIALERNAMQIAPEHLTYALVSQEGEICCEQTTIRTPRSAMATTPRRRWSNARLSW